MPRRPRSSRATTAASPHGNPAAPRRATQVAFLQGAGSSSQAVAGWAAGSYAHHLRRRPARQLPGVAAGLPGAGQRRRWSATFTPSGTSYQSYTTATFTVAAGRAHDHVPGPGQRRRRQHRLHRSGRRRSRPARRADRRRGLRAGAGGLRPVPVRPDRLALDLLRRLRHLGQQQRLHRRQPAGPRGRPGRLPPGTGSFSQTVAGWAAGSYVISFDAAQRGNYQASRQDFQVLVDAGRRRDLHALRHVVPGLRHRRLHRRRRRRTRSRSRAWTPPAATTPPSSIRSSSHNRDPGWLLYSTTHHLAAPIADARPGLARKPG